MTISRSAFVAEVVSLYLDDPDTPMVPSSADWDIAANLFDRRVPIETVRLAFKLAFVRRHHRPTGQPLSPIRSLAYFRTVALNLTTEESEPVYASYIDQLFLRLRHSLQTHTPASIPSSSDDLTGSPKTAP